MLILVKALSLPINLLQIFRDVFNGYYPREYALWRLKRTNQHPITFQEKVLYKIARDRREILRIFADKYEVRGYVEKKIGSEYLIPLISVHDYIDTFLNAPLPRNCVIKPNNFSGTVLIVSEMASIKNKLPHLLKLNVNERYIVHPDAIDPIRLRLLLRRWLLLDYYGKRGQYPEWAYKDIRGKILVEEFLSDDFGVAADYRFFVFNGVCQYIEVDTSWDEFPTRTIFDRNWNRQDIKLKYPARIPEPKKPRNLSHAIELAEKLAQESDHLRVDFYISRERIYFGELTNYHTGGKQVFEPDYFNFIFGQSWHPEFFY